MKKAAVSALLILSILLTLTSCSAFTSRLIPSSENTEGLAEAFYYNGGITSGEHDRLFRVVDGTDLLFFEDGTWRLEAFGWFKNAVIMSGTYTVDQDLHYTLYGFEDYEATGAIDSEGTLILSLSHPTVEGKYAAELCFDPYAELTEK